MPSLSIEMGAGGDTPVSLGGGSTDLDVLTGLSPEQREKLTGNLAKVQEDEIKARAPVLDEMNRKMTGYQHLSEDAFNATSASMAAIPPKWDANAESEKYATNPIMAFGSAASLFGILAASFTHAPMMNALNASASAMNAYAKGDQEAYNRAHEAWKENTDLAIKRHNMMRESYQDAMEMLKTEPAIARAKLEAIATQYGDKTTLAMLQNGFDPRIDEIMSKRALAAEQVSRAKLGMLRIDAVKRVQDARNTGNEEEIRKAEQNLRDVQEALSPSVGRGGTALQQMKAAALREFQEAQDAGDQPRMDRAQAVLDKIGEMEHPSAYRPKPGTEGAFMGDPKNRQAYAEKYPGLSVPELNLKMTEDWTAAHQKKPMLRAGSQDQFMEVRKRELLEINAMQRQAADDARARGEDVPDVPQMTESEAHLQALKAWQTAKAVKAVDSNPAAERSYADMVYKGQLPNPSSFYLRTHPLFADAMKGLETENNKPYDPTLYARNMAAARVEAAAAPRSYSEALKNVQANKAATKAFGDFVALHGEALVKAAEKVGLDGTTAIEKYILQGEQALGDPDVSRYFFMLQTFQTDTARLITSPRLTGQLTDTARREIQDTMPTAPNVQTLRELLETVQQDVKRRDATLTTEANRLLGLLHQQPESEPQKTEDPNAGWSTLPDGRRIREIK